MFDELLKEWANEQGFQTWSQDHAAVLRNLTKWLNIHAVEQNMHPTAYGVFAAVFFFGFCCGTVAFNAICGGG